MTFLLVGFAEAVLAQETNSVVSTNEVTATATNAQPSEAQQALRAYLQLQEQVHAAILAIEQNRQEASAAVQRNAEVVSTRLKLIEQAMSLQREQETEAMQKSNHMLLMTSATFGGVGLLAMILTAFFLVRTMNRLAEISSVIPKGLALGANVQATAALGGMEGSVMTLPPESSRLLGAIERLEKRICELESGGANQQLLPMAKEKPSNGQHEADVLEPEDSEAIESNGIGDHERLSVILGKGQTLLNLGQSENALICFDEVLATDPNHAEALVKKGTALERLRRWEEALDCYDRAIAADSGMTLAYLYKGGVFNQLEKFSEALECYEQALRTQQKTAVPA